MGLILPGRDVEFVGGPMCGRRGRTNRAIWYVPTREPGRVAVYTTHLTNDHLMEYQGDAFESPSRG